MKNKEQTNIKGGFCPDNPCNKIEIEIDPSSVLNDIISGVLTPINFLMRGIFYTIRFIIEYWNDLISRLSIVFESLIINLIYSVNGYIDIFNMIADEIKNLMTIALSLLTNNPIVLLSIWLTPLVQETLDFMLDSLTFEIISGFYYIDLFNGWEKFKLSLQYLKPLYDFFIAYGSFIIGKTVKPSCSKNIYGTNSQKDNYCHEYYVPKCRLNIRTIYNLIFYTIIILYFAGWLSFFKIFYPHGSNVSLMNFIREKYFKDTE